MGWGTRIQVVASPMARFVRVMWASVDGAAVLLTAMRVLALVTPGVLSVMSWLLVPAVRGRRWFTGLCRR